MYIFIHLFIYIGAVCVVVYPSGLRKLQEQACIHVYIYIYIYIYIAIYIAAAFGHALSSG